MPVIDTTLEQMRESYDWNTDIGVMSYAKEFKLDDVAEVIASHEGEGDGEDWIGVFKLKNGKYGLVIAGCDYTGWDWQAGGHSAVADTLDELVRFKMTTGERKYTGLTLVE